MRGYMFRNRWFALLFVATTLAGVTKLIGTDKDQGSLQQAAGQIAVQKAQAERMTTDTQTSSNDSISAGEPPLADDEELIDDATGEDPTPVDEFAASNPTEPAVPVDEVTIISRDVPGQSQPAATPAQVPVQ